MLRPRPHGILVLALALLAAQPASAVEIDAAYWHSASQSAYGASALSGLAGGGMLVMGLAEDTRAQRDERLRLAAILIPLSAGMYALGRYGDDKAATMAAAPRVAPFLTSLRDAERERWTVGLTAATTMGTTNVSSSDLWRGAAWLVLLPASLIMALSAAAKDDKDKKAQQYNIAGGLLLAGWGCDIVAGMQSHARADDRTTSAVDVTIGYRRHL